MLTRLVAFTIALSLALPAKAGDAPAQGLAMYGTPALSDRFDHFPYANPAAPKGGTLTQAAVGSFDSVNPFIVKGQAAAGIRELVYESLMKRSLDEPFSLYGLLAEHIEISTDRTRITFHLRPEAHFSDGVPLTAEDVAFSLDVLRREGRPNYREYYGKVIRIERPDSHTISFLIDPAAQDRELPLILGLMPVLPKHVFAKEPFDRTTFDPPIGSGAYRVETLDPGRRITYIRDPGYWGAGLSVNRGFNNFERLRFDYYRDETSAFEAFKAGLIDLWSEQDPGRWAEGYQFNALRAGSVQRAEIPSGTPSGMYGFAFNTRRAQFGDPRIRRALSLLFDFSQINRMLLQGAYQRIESYFDHSDLAAKGPADAGERALLAPFPDAVTPDILAQGWVPPRGDDPAATRENRRNALALFEQAGYVLENNRLVQRKTGTPFDFELLLTNPAEIRIALAFRAALARVGVLMEIRIVDSAQFEMRRQRFDFDVTSFRWSGTLSPGNEQIFRWGSAAADSPGSYNVAGIKNPAVDAMIGQVLKAQSRETLRTAVRALDRVLLSGAYVIPLFYLPYDRLAYRTAIRRPDRATLWGFDPLVTPLLWWRDPL